MTMLRIDHRRWVNLDHVTAIKQVRRKVNDQWLDETEFWAGDDLLGKSTDADLDPDALLAPVVPAAPGAEAVEIDVSDDDAGRPTEADVHVYRYHIVAWRVTSDFVSPVLPGSLSDTDNLLIALPDGALYAPFDCIYSNLDAAKDGRLQAAQERWEKKHAQPEAAA